MAESIFAQEIRQQPEVIRNLIAQENNRIAEIAANLDGHFRYIVIAARGTSDNAARYAQYLFGAHNRLPVALATPSLYTLYQAPPKLQDALVIGISQSGQSPDIVAVLAEARKQECPTLAIVNDTDSPLAATADAVIPLHAGVERAVAATKTYTASLAAMAMLSCALSRADQQAAELACVPDWMQLALDKAQQALPHVERYRYAEQCTVISRGFNYATAFEIALKIKELTHVLAEPYSSADFRHGPIAIIHQGFPVILVAPSGVVDKDLSVLAGALQSLNSEVIAVSDQAELLEQAKVSFPIPAGVPEWLSPLIYVLPGQLFSLQLTLARGLNPDAPVGLTKVTHTY